jgi:oligosaccharide repeat unit polymerase
MHTADGFRGRAGVASDRPPGVPRTVRRSPAVGGGFAVWFLPVVLSTIGVVFFALFVITGESRNLQCAVAFMVTAAPFLMAAVEGPERLLHPLSVVGFTMLLGVAGQTVYVTYGDPSNLPTLLSGLRTDVLTPGLLVVSIAVAALAVGYAAGRPNQVPKPGRLLQRGVLLGFAGPSPRRTFWAVLVLCAIAIVAFAVYAPKVGLNTPADILTSRKRIAEVEGGKTVFGYYRFGMSLAGLAFILAVYTMVRQRVSWYSGLGAVALASLTLTVAYSTVTSSRSELFATLATAAFMTIAMRGREPRPGKIAAVVVAAMLGVTFLGGLRAVNQGQASTLSSTTEADALVKNAVGSRSWMDIGPNSVVVQRVPDAYPYQYGKTLVSILWAPVPKTVWPEKPPVRLGPVIGPAVFGFDVNRRTGDPPGLVGELWLNGGLIAVVIGMIIFGVLVRRVERWHHLASATQGLAAIPYGVLVVALCLRLPASDITGVTIWILEDLLPLALLLWLVRERTVDSPRPILDHELESRLGGQGDQASRYRRARR